MTLDIPQPSMRPPETSHEGSLLHEKLLRLMCGISAAMGVFYGAYFLFAGMPGASLLGLCLVAAGAITGACAQRTGQYRTALDCLSATLYVMVACVALFQDGVSSPALRWLLAPLCLSLLAGSSALAATFCGLFLLEAVVL